MTNKQTMTNQIMKAVEDATSSLFDEIDDLEKQKAICVSQIQDQEQLINKLKYEIESSDANGLMKQQQIIKLVEQVADQQSTINNR